MTCCIISWAYRGQTRRGDDIEMTGDKSHGRRNISREGRISAIFWLKRYKNAKLLVNLNLKNIRVKYHYAQKKSVWSSKWYKCHFIEKYINCRDTIFSFWFEEGRQFFWERAKGKGCPLLPLPANEGEDSENAVCSCKQMAGNYLQFAIYTPVLALSPARRLSFSALSFHPGAIHRLPGNCQRSAPRNAGVAGQ